MTQNCKLGQLFGIWQKSLIGTLHGQFPEGKVYYALEHQFREIALAIYWKMVSRKKTKFGKVIMRPNHQMNTLFEELQI